MKDLVCDTDILSEILTQYLNNSYTPHFVSNGFLSSTIEFHLNETIKNSMYTKGFVIASAFAFVELARKFDSIFKGTISILKFRAFIDSPPEWFLIEPLSLDLFEPLRTLPSYIVSKKASKPIEWADAIHVATALLRENCYLATTDQRLRDIDLIKEMIIY